MSEGVVLLIGSGQRAYREYLFPGLGRRAPLWLIDEATPVWQRRYVAGSCTVPPVGGNDVVPDEERLIDAALEVASRRPVLGVCTYDELLVIATARVGERLGLPGLGVATARRCRDKLATRQALTRAGLPQPRFALVQSQHEAVSAGGEVGYPLVLKPRGMGASVGVVQVDRPTDLEAAFAVATHASRFGPPTFDDGVLMEEMVEGMEISVDGAVVEGEYQPFCLARKRTGLAPYFEEVAHLVDPVDDLLQDPGLREILDAAHQALGVRNGVTHTEVRLAERGLVVIEVNARLGGDLIPYLGRLASGIDAGALLAEVAMGIRPSLKPRPRGCAGIRFLYPPQDCRVLDLHLPRRGAVRGLTLARPMVKPGATVRLPPRAHVGRCAFFVVRARRPSECDARLEQAVAQARLDYEPLPLGALDGERPW